jgi:hypothetical protein
MHAKTLPENFSDHAAKILKKFFKLSAEKIPQIKGFRIIFTGNFLVIQKI